MAFWKKNIVQKELCLCQALGKKNVPMALDSSKTVTIVVPEENGAHLIKAIVEEANDNYVKLTLRPTNDISLVQRRRYYRLARPAVNIQYLRINENHENEEQLQMPVECIVWDICGDGVGIVIRNVKPFRPKDKIILFLTIPEHETMEITGEVVRVVTRSIIRNESLLGIQFIKIRESDRNRIIKYITQEQLMLRKRKKR